MQFSTDRLILRPMRLEDAPFVFELVNTKEWIENIGPRNVPSINAAKKYIQEKMVDHYEKHGYGNFLMMRKADGVKIGCISLYNRDDVEGVDIGFAMLPQYMSKGYAFEGAEVIKLAAKDEYGLKGITAFTTKENEISQKLILKLGLEFKKTIIFGDEKEELLFYELKF
ncbi:MAG: GNAT family N-acetyltransferase [Bacteroidota bacterium]